MTMRAGGLDKAHRLLAPRVAYLIGTRSQDGESNLIPVTNLTSVSTDPQLVLLAVHRRWRTHKNLVGASGFSLSVPRADQRDGVWKLGARYSRHDFPNPAAKLRECGLPLSDRPELFGPVLSNGLGWLSCHITQRLDPGGDHGVFVGEVTHVELNDEVFTDSGTPIDGLHPLMQITGNLFTTASETCAIPYGT